MIIFDLDDTLLDTSGTVTPFKMRECLKKLIEDGAQIDTFEKAYADLMALNRLSARSRDAVRQFAEKARCNPERALKELTSPLPEGFPVLTTPHAKEVLTYLRHKSFLCLVTGGFPPFQREKMEKAGLELSLFSKIAIPEDCSKKPFYENFVKEFSMEPERVWVCGDRVEVDLLPAHALRFRTVHMQWGRGKGIRCPKWVDYSISLLQELKGIIQ